MCYKKYKTMQLWGENKALLSAKQTVSHNRTKNIMDALELIGLKIKIIHTCTKELANSLHAQPPIKEYALSPYPITYLLLAFAYELS